MADAVNTQDTFTGGNRIVRKFSNISDGTGESSVVKVDISTLIGPDGVAPSALVIEEAKWDVQGFSSVQLAFDATTDDEALTMSGNDYGSWVEVGGIQDPQSAGSTGDLVLTTIGATATATYDITLVIRLKQ